MNRTPMRQRPRLGQAGLCLAVAAMAAVAATLGVFARGDGAVVAVRSVRGGSTTWRRAASTPGTPSGSSLLRSAFGYAFAAVFGVTFVAMATATVGMLVSAAVVEGPIEIVPVVIFCAAAVWALALLVRIYAGPTAIGDGRPARGAPRAAVLDAR